MRQRELMRRIDPATRRSNGWRNSHPCRVEYAMIGIVAAIMLGFWIAVGVQSGFIGV